jgi:hypothetical protein
MIGGMIWGIGSALMEENVVDLRYGSFVNQDLASYHVAANADVGELDAMFLREDDPHGSPLGSKELGELGICGAGAAVINATHNATGARIRDFPATPDKLLRNRGARRLVEITLHVLNRKIVGLHLPVHLIRRNCGRGAGNSGLGALLLSHCSSCPEARSKSGDSRCNDEGGLDHRNLHKALRGTGLP